MVRKRGLEPPRDCSHKLLRLARLPIPPLPPTGPAVRNSRPDATFDYSAPESVNARYSARSATTGLTLAARRAGMAEAASAAATSTPSAAA